MKVPRPSGLPWRIPAWAWKALKLPGAQLPHRKPAWFWVWRRWRLGLRLPRRTPITMYDSVTPGAIPATAEAFAGYVGGNWPNFGPLSQQHPAAHKLSIAIASSEDADCLDVEPGDATNAEAAAWVRRQQARGVKRPCLYTSVSNWPALLKALKAAGISRKQIRIWSAHYTYKQHRCNWTCGFGFVERADATQWTNKSGGKNLDESICSPNFFD